MPVFVPLPEPFDKVAELWKKFLAEVSTLARVQSQGVSIGLYLDDTGMELAARITRRRPTSDAPTVLQAPHPEV